MKKRKKLTEKQKNIIEIIIAIAILILFIGYRIYEKYTKTKNEMLLSQQKTIVTDDSRFFTVISCINKYLNTVQNGNPNEILLLLNEEYKEAKGINANNYQKFIPSLNKSNLYEYEGNEMYQKIISKNVVEYYVYGNIKKSNMDDVAERTKYNLTVVLYENEFTYSIKTEVANI